MAVIGVYGDIDNTEKNVFGGDFVGVWVRLAFSDRVFRVWVLGWYWVGKDFCS